MPVPIYNMEFIETLIIKINEKTPFTYINFDDQHTKKNITENKNMIKNMANCNIKNYYIGLPCKSCYYDIYENYRAIIRNTSGCTLNCIWKNSNITKTFELLKYLLNNSDYTVRFITMDDSEYVAKKVGDFMNVHIDHRQIVNHIGDDNGTHIINIYIDL